MDWNWQPFNQSHKKLPWVGASLCGILLMEFLERSENLQVEIQSASNINKANFSLPIFQNILETYKGTKRIGKIFWK